MPNLPPHPCKCGKLTTNKFCDSCTAKNPQKPFAYDRWRGSSSKRGYGSRWKKYRDGFLRDNPLCLDPQQRHPGQIKPAQHVDHIIPVSGPGDPLFWRADNHQGLCASCHSAKTAAENGGFGNTIKNHIL